MGYDRHRAIALKAADAKQLLKSSFPFVLSVMTPAQIEQVQKVLDADVVNPEINKQANEIYRKSVRAQSGDIVMRDQQMVDRAYRLNATMIRVSEQDKHVRLDVHKLLTPNALVPVTDNPDEVSFLAAIRHVLDTKGIWLRFDHKLVRDPEDYGHWMIDPRTFQAWLSLGYGGDTIPTPTGRIDREALLGTTAIGAGYLRSVDWGPVQKALDRQMDSLNSDIDDGMAEHHRLIMRKLDAPIVGGISDTLGGAHLPDQSIWDHPYKLLRKARELNVNGNISGSLPYLIVGALMTRSNAQLLAEYVDDSVSGAGRAVTILKVAKRAGQVAEVGLAVTGVGGLVRGTVSVAGGTAAADASVDAAADKFLTKVIKANPEFATELNEVRVLKSPKGTVLGGVKPGTSSGAGTGWHKW